MPKNRREAYESTNISENISVESKSQEYYLGFYINFMCYNKDIKIG